MIDQKRKKPGTSQALITDKLLSSKLADAVQAVKRIAQAPETQTSRDFLSLYTEINTLEQAIMQRIVMLQEQLHKFHHEAQPESHLGLSIQQTDKPRQKQKSERHKLKMLLGEYIIKRILLGDARAIVNTHFKNSLSQPVCKCH